MEFTVHFQRGSRLGARSLRMEHVEAEDRAQAVRAAQRLFPTSRTDGFRIVRVDHFDADTGRTVVDF